MAARVPFSSSVVKVHNSKAYRNMHMTRERISFTFDPRDMLLSLSLYIGFSIRAAVTCIIFERTSAFQPLSETIALRYLKLVTVPRTVPRRFSYLFIGHIHVHMYQVIIRIIEDASYQVERLEIFPSNCHKPCCLQPQETADIWLETGSVVKISLK